MARMRDPGERTLYVAPKARSMPLLNHVVAALILVGVAIQSIAHGHHVAWAAVELIVALTLVVAGVRHLHERRTKPPEEELHEHIGWVEIAGGVFVGIEAYTKTLGPHHVSFVVLSFVPAFLLVLVGAFESRIASRFFIRSTADRLTVRISRWNRFESPWSEIRQITTSPREVTIELADGSTRSIRTGALWQGDYVRDWVLARASENVAFSANEPAPNPVSPVNRPDTDLLGEAADGANGSVPAISDEAGARHG